MSYRIRQSDPAQMTTEELFAEIDSFVQLAVEVAERMSLILAELRKRKQPHAFFRHPVLSFFQSIADGALSAEAAIMLGNQGLIKAVLPLAKDEQVSIANGAQVPVAVVKDDGQIASDDWSIRRMDPETIKRAFGPHGLRPVDEQAEMIRAAGRIQRYGSVTVIKEEQVLKIGNQKIRPEDLRGPLAALGYKIDLTRNATEEAC